jgi:hypothetical protein
MEDTMAGEVRSPAPGSPPPTASAEPAFHNSVLIRSHETGRSSNHAWMVAVPLVLALFVGVGVLYYVQTHPGPPVVNHAVEQSTHDWWR